MRKNEFSLRVVETHLNWADVGTKSLDKDRLDSLMLQMPLSQREGANGGSGVRGTLVSVCIFPASSLHLPCIFQ